jgi:hypothetical protein
MHGQPANGAQHQQNDQNQKDRAHAQIPQD